MNTDLKERDTTNSATLYVIYIILVVNIILISLLNSIYFELISEYLFALD